MRNIFLFIRRFFNLILFFVLQGTAIYILSTHNKTHQAVLGSVANEVSGAISGRYNNIEYYFHLRKTNDSLVKENARLHNIQPSSFESPDTINIFKIDSLMKDTMGVRKFRFMEAKVVNSSVTQENNYITLHRGSKQGVKTDMAVIGPDGIVGRVILVSDNYSRVMSLLNRRSKVNAMLKKGYYTGDLEWDGKDPSYLLLSSISKSAQVKIGDTVLTSNVSNQLSFPSGLMVGTVAEIIPNPESGFLSMKVKSSTNFYSLQYVYLTENIQWQEQKTLEDKTPKD